MQVWGCVFFIHEITPNLSWHEHNFSQSLETNVGSVWGASQVHAEGLAESCCTRSQKPEGGCRTYFRHILSNLKTRPDVACLYMILFTIKSEPWSPFDWPCNPNIWIPMVQFEFISCYARIIRQRRANMNEDIFKVTHFPGGWRNELEIEVEIRKGT